MKREPYGMIMQRPTISHEGDGRDSDRDESATETSFLNREGKEVVSTNHIDREIVGFGCHAVVTI